ncbi:hypothetical protein GXW82_16760 [Streptacidiphilus sp. 4-A2]|nr:hypothetical protein [Streptacidiphilus sp. 4-A2]
MHYGRNGGGDLRQLVSGLGVPEKVDIWIAEHFRETGHRNFENSSTKPVVVALGEWL